MSFGGKQISQQNTTISNGEWPELSTEEFRKLRRIAFVFEETSLAMAVSIAAMEVNDELKDVDPVKITGNKVFAYKRAVYSRAHADLLPEFATQDRREVAENAAEDSPEQAARFRAQSIRDICLLLGRSANGVELI
ncbi:head completion/stabilization protein [Photobacterium sp. CCB-ST2H9]|uniref:head completion/stabilization protein n=1 Tax=Photobacterium sp. CCB-ST2H9 TaxID=2912855 RepID=UPI002006ADFE|nr:head completion/stabilization protein [Photobacterium sp. CCB-ST2H9]UTM59220.1 head completion/stabilization protein [Photobacterium sp. CCB-ST2H9]